MSQIRRREFDALAKRVEEIAAGVERIESMLIKAAFPAAAPRMSHFEKLKQQARDLLNTQQPARDLAGIVNSQGAD